MSSFIEVVIGSVGCNYIAFVNDLNTSAPPPLHFFLIEKQKKPYAQFPHSTHDAASVC